MNHITLILGGARSGKSAYAERLAVQRSPSPLYLATADAADEEMMARIAAHQQRRGPEWLTKDIPLALPQEIAKPDYTGAVILVDCLTLWLSNLMHHQYDIAQQTDALLAALDVTKAEIILVSNEVGQGIVPDNALARQFRDAAGVLHQRIAARADCVVLVTAGLPHRLKG